MIELKHRREQYFLKHPDHLPPPPRAATEESIVEVAKECFCEEFGAPKFEGVCSWCVGKQEAEDEAADEKEETPDGR